MGYEPANCLHYYSYDDGLHLTFNIINQYGGVIRVIILASACLKAI